MKKKLINELTNKPVPSDNDYVIGHDNAVPNGIRTKWVDVINKVKGALGIGSPNGVAPLDAGGNVPAEHIPYGSSRVMTAATGGWFRLQFSPNTSYIVEVFAVNEASSNNTPSQALLQFKTGASVTNNVTFAAARIISGPWTGNITVFNDSGNLAVHIVRPTSSAYSTVIATARSNSKYRIVPISSGGSGGVPGSATNVVTVTPAT